MPIPFRILDNRPVYFDQLGRPASGGRLDFFEAGTLDPKSVYADPSLSVDNGPSVTLDSAGRTEVDTWGDGAYKVRLYDADGVLQSEADDVQVPGGAAQQIPALENGKFLTNDGALLLWDTIIQVPDPTGQNGKALFSDGINAIWQSLPAGSTVVVTITASSIKISDGTTALMLQWGSDTIAASGAPTANKTFSFGTAFLSLHYVNATISGSSGVANPGGGIPALAVSDQSLVGARANIDTNAFGSTVNVVNPVPFTWFAVGTVTP